MAAYAEGLNILAKADIGAERHAVDAETAPLVAPRVLPLRPRPGGDHRGLAAGLRRRQLAARPDRRGARRRPRARRLRRPGQRLRRGALDDRGGDRRGRARARAVGGAVPALQLPRPVRRRRQGAVGDARRVRRPRRAQGRRRVDGAHRGRREAGRPAASRCPRAVRRHRRSGQAQALPGPVPPRAARRADGPDHRRRPQRLDRRRLQGPRPRVRARQRRGRRRGRHHRHVRPDGPHPGRLLGPRHVAIARRHARRVRVADGRVLHGDPARHVPDGRREAGVGGVEQAGPDRRREAVRSRPGLGAGAQPDAARRLPRGAHLPHRPLPRQGGRRGPPRVPLLQHAPRAAVEPQLRAQRAGDDGRVDRRRGSGQLLRGRRGDPRRAAEPPPAGRLPAGDGAAGRPRGVVPAGREGQGAGGDGADRPVVHWSAASTSATATSRASTRTRPSRRTSPTRLQIDSWRWAGVPWYVRVRQGARRTP